MTFRITLPVVTDRLLLRPGTVDDIDAVHAYQRRPDVAKYLYRPPWTRKKTAEVLAEPTTFARTGDSLVLYVERLARPGVIGEIVLKLADLTAMQAEIGWVFHPDAGGHGYATEGASAILALGFDTCGFHRIFARLDEENTASARVCQRLGMRREARLVESDIRDGVWGTELIYAVLQREWRGSPS